MIVFTLKAFLLSDPKLLNQYPDIHIRIELFEIGQKADDINFSSNGLITQYIYNYNPELP